LQKGIEVNSWLKWIAKTIWNAWKIWLH